MFATVITSFKAKRQYFSFDGSLAIQRELVFKFLGQLADQKVFKKCPAEISDGFYQHPCIQQIQQLFGVLKNYAEQFDQLHIYLKAYLCIEVKNVYHRFYKTRARRPFLSKFALCQKL